MSMTRRIARVTASFDEATTAHRAEAAIERQAWAEARELYRALAIHTPGMLRYRVMLAYARGHVARAEGDEARARDEWRRALVLDPSCELAARALGRAPRTSWIDRLFARSPA